MVVGFGEFEPGDHGTDVERGGFLDRSTRSATAPFFLFVFDLALNDDFIGGVDIGDSGFDAFGVFGVNVEGIFGAAHGGHEGVGTQWDIFGVDGHEAFGQGGFDAGE